MKKELNKKQLKQTSGGLTEQELSIYKKALAGYKKALADFKKTHSQFFIICDPNAAAYIRSMESMIKNMQNKIAEAEGKTIK